MTEEINDAEIEILREVAGELPPRAWGGHVGAILEWLAGHGYITRKFGGKITDKGRAALEAARHVRSQKP